MKLPKDTWHYRNYKLWLHRSQSTKARELKRGYRKLDLCTYIRIALLWGAISRVGRWFDAHPDTAIGVVFVVLWGFLGGLVFLDAETTWFEAFVVYPAIVFGILAAISTLLVGIYTLLQWWQEKLPTVDDENPNIIFEHLKAKKSKVCPLIEFEHDELEEVK